MTSVLKNSPRRYFDRFARLHVVVLNRPIQAFQLCGYTGLALAIALSLTLTILLGLSPWIMIGVICAAIMTFLGLAMVTKIVTGEEQLIYYHHEIAIVMMATLFLKLINRPILPYLDVTLLGIGAFLFCGRVGCLMVGCCHGRPCKWGICYGETHVGSGFTHSYKGVRLFPIQAVESLWVLVVVFIGVVFVLTGPGSSYALAWYVIHYDIGRFVFEFARGDPERPYYWGFSEGQWISVVLMCAVVWGETVGTLPFSLWHVIATAGLLSAMAVIILLRWFQGAAACYLSNPRHIRELVELVNLISNRVSDKTMVACGRTLPAVVPMGVTSLGIHLSAGHIIDADRSIDHFAISSESGKMTEATAKRVANLIARMRPTCSADRLIDGGNGVFHLLIHSFGAGDRE